MVTMTRQSGAQDKQLEDGWFVVTSEGRLTRARVNTGHHRDRSLPGWLRVNTDGPETPRHHLVSAGQSEADIESPVTCLHFRWSEE